MASEAPPCTDVMEYQFKLHQKSTVFNATGFLRNNVSLLALSSNYGLIFIGDPNKPEIRVLQHRNIIDLNESGEKLLIRNVQISGIPNNVSISCDGLLLAVGYTQNNTDFLTIYSVPSFLTANIEIRFNIRVYPEDNANIIQILWNPVMSNIVAVILNNGSVGMYNLKETSYVFDSLDKNEQAKCGCWSPKGKQIVIGFPNGKLVQFKPDLKAVKVIPCPTNIHEHPFDTIAVQWLSTYQFSVVFWRREEDSQPSLYILNAPKTGNQTYINYGDICYSGCGPRQPQTHFIHIQAWNILLMTSANSVEVGILGTKENGETPVWQQYITPDEARIELPLTNDKQETFPIGIALDTGCTHELTIGETKIPVMPIIHVLSTHGMLISFNFLNLIPGSPGICSPPNIVPDVSKLFRPIEEILNTTSSSKQQSVSDTKTNPPLEVSFSLSSNATSTPTADRKGNLMFGSGDPESLFGNITPKPLFGTTNIAAPVKPLSTENSLFSGLQKQQTSQPQIGGNLFGGQTFGTKPAFTNDSLSTVQQQTVTTNNEILKSSSITPFGNLNLPPVTSGNSAQPNLTFGSSIKEGNQLTFSGQPLGQNKLFSFTTPQQQQRPDQQQQTLNKQQTVTKSDDIEKAKPLYTVPPTFTPNQQQLIQQQQPQKPLQSKQIQNGIRKNIKDQEGDLEVDDIIKQMIFTQINAFEKELHDLSGKSEDLIVSVNEIEETRNYTKRLNDLQELNDRAKDGGIEADVQILRHSLNECLTMIAEVKSKLNMYNNPHLSQLAVMSNLNQTNRRQLAKLKQLLATNEVQLNAVNQLIDAQWSNYQDLVRNNTSKKQYIPNLEGIYQTLIRQKDIVARERIKLNYYKAKMGVKMLLDNDNKKIEQNIDANSLADLILSMSLSEQVIKDNSRLNDEKLKIIRETIKGHQIVKIKPQRPNRIGLNSEVILEAKAKTVKKRDGAITKPERMEKERIKDEQRILTKPTPTKSIALNTQQPKKVEPKKQQQQQQQDQQPIQMLPPNVQIVATGSQKIIQQKLAQKENHFTPATTNPPMFPSIGSSFVKPGGEFTQPTATTNVFSGMPSNQTIFGNKTLEPTKSMFGSLSTAFQNENIVVDIRSSKKTFSFTPEKVDVKEQIPVSFVPKIIENDQQTLAFGFMTIQDENKPTIEILKDITSSSTSTVTNKQTPISSSNQSLFSSLSMGSSSGPLSGMGFNILSTKDTNTNQTSTNLTPTQNTSNLSLSSASSFKALSLSAKPETEVTKTQEISLSGENLTSSTIAQPFSFTLNTKAPSSTASNAPSGFSFGGIQKSTITTTATTTNATLPIVLTGFNLGTNLSTNVVSTTASLPTTVISSTTDTSLTNRIAAPTDLSTKKDSVTEQSNILEGLNICKPSTSENVTSTASTPPKVFDTTLFGVKSTSTTTTVESKLSFGIATIATTSTGSAFGTISSTTTDVVGPTFDKNVTTTSSLFSTTCNTSTTPLFGNTMTTNSVPIFGATTQSTVPSIFGAATQSISTSSFGVSTATTAITSSTFGDTSTPSTSAFAITSPSTSSSLFGTTTSTISSPTFDNVTTMSPSGLFSGVPKPTQPAFGTTGTGSFASTTPMFGMQANQPVSSAGSIFGGNSTSTPAFGMMATSASTAFGVTSVSQSSSPFAQVANTSATLFGSPKSETTANLFGTVSQSSPTSGGSLFGGSAFGNTGQSSGSIFGGGGGGTTTQSSGFSSAFAQPPTSPFGGSTSQQQTQQSPFGSGSNTSGNTPTFGQNTFGTSLNFGQSTSGTFGSNSPGGAFAQGGPSVAQTGFGSPSSSFAAKPAFGGSPTFGGAPTFGSGPTFGGAPTFGNTKPTFGMFGSTNTGAFSPPAQKNNLFESLGSSDSGLSFGNLAQNTNPNNMKPQFGGSSFSSWR